MALVCPVGHPPGVGTTFCRLCGRSYVDVADLPADHQLAVLAAQRETLDQVRAAVAPAAALPVPEPVRAPVSVPAAAAPSPEPTTRLAPPPPGAPPLRTAPPDLGAPLVPQQPAPPQVPAVGPGGVHIQMPLVQAPPAAPVETMAPVETAPPVPVELQVPVTDEHAADEQTQPAHPRRDRVVLVATLAGFVGGAVSGAGVHYLLG
jgi:hypothetical protein